MAEQSPKKVRTHCHCGNSYVMAPAGESASCGEPTCTAPIGPANRGNVTQTGPARHRGDVEKY